MRSYRQGQQQAGAALCHGHHGLPEQIDYEEQRYDFGGEVDWEEWFRGYCDWMAFETGRDPRCGAESARRAS